MTTAYLRRALPVMGLLAVLLAGLLYLDRNRILATQTPPLFYFAGDMRDAQFRPANFSVSGAATGHALLATLPGGLAYRSRLNDAPLFGLLAPQEGAQVGQVIRRDECLRIDDVKLVQPAAKPGLPPRIESIATANPATPPCDPAAVGVPCTGLQVWFQGRRADC